MEDWRELADRARATLLDIAADGPRSPDYPLGLLTAAYRKLATSVYISRRTLAGATDLELSAIPLPPPDGHGPLDLIELARLELDRLGGEHAMAGHVLTLCRTPWPAVSFPPSPARAAWISAAEKLTRAACFGVTTAALRARRMRHDVRSLYLAASIALA